ncbi:YybH family protein [Virgibacillus flavescens]|uniref:YybH family protein n=1 Tax=Virgibacillus flavescens TaxID=1611422 RepID=UPI003D324B51
MTMGVRLVQDVLENYKRSVYERDVEKFLSTYAADVHIYDCWGSWECMGVSPWRESVTAWFNGLREDENVVKVDFTDVTIEESTDVAFVHCAVTFAGHSETSGEKLQQMTNRFTFCLKKVDDSWLITHEHSSLPIDMGTGKGMFDLK